MDFTGYEIKEKISYDEGSDFFKRYLLEKNIIVYMYFINILLASIFILVNLMKKFTFEHIMTSIGEVLFLLIPYCIVHELLHLVGYIISGARKGLSIGMSKGIFYASASNCIISCKKYMFSALLPTILISLLSIIVYIFFYDLRTAISIFYCVQLLSSYLDITIASYCSKMKHLYYCENAEKKEMYFLKKKEF